MAWLNNMPRKYLIPAGVVFGALICVALYYGLSKKFVITDVHLTLKKEPVWEDSMEEIHSQILQKLQGAVGKNIFQVSLKELSQVAQSDPRVGSVKILRRLPRHLFVELQPRKPLLVLLNPHSGKIHPLSMDAQILSPLPTAQVPDLPILRGAPFVKQKELRETALQFFHLMPEQGKFSRREISEVQYSSQEKSLVFVLSKNGKLIKVGAQPLPIKTKRIESVLRYLDQKNIKWRVIDARFSQKIVVSTGQAI